MVSIPKVGKRILIKEKEGIDTKININPPNPYIKMKKIKNIYYAETPDEKKKIGGTYITGLVIELEDGRLFRQQSTDPIMSFEEVENKRDYGAEGEAEVEARGKYEAEMQAQAEAEMQAEMEANQPPPEEPPF